MKRRYESRINREQSIIKLRAVPIASVILGSMITTLPIITTLPLLPPFGLLMLLAWRLIRPGFWPLWVGFPLGLIDDIFSGQPIGSAIFLWSIILIAAETVDSRIKWRDYWQDWLIGSFALSFAIIGGWLLAYLSGGIVSVLIIVPQIFISILIFPLVMRFCARLDRWRLAT